MYRERGDVAGRGETAEFVYQPTDRSNRTGFTLQWVLLVPAVGAIAPVVFGLASLAPVGFVVGVGIGVWGWKSAPSVRGTVFRVTDRELVVLHQSGRREIVRCLLDDLVDVSLDTRTVQKVTEGQSAIPAMRFIDTNVGGEVDETRIVLGVRNRGQHTLTDRYLPHSETVEWFAKIRSFLRKQGWLPPDER